MQNLDPTYLRYIYDGLIKGSVHPENSSELPDGLIGLYEEAFEEYIPVLKRQQKLQRFALFALLKKEVSAAFVTEVLGEGEADILEFINAYASWFNSPEPGKFQLYHERLKVYVLQKLSEKEIQTIHEKLIARLEKSIEEQKTDEFERYALEFLSEHLYIDSMLSKDGQKLIDLGYSQSHWQRQLKISKGYTWTKNGLKAVMTWASKFNDDEVIECGLQMVDLHHQEQNAAPQIVALVAEGDFDSALIRIEQFGSNDEEGLQRKFILYMLCLMELTLLDSKNKPYRKEGIEKLLKHFDEQIPIDYFILNWNDFFSSYLMFLMAFEWADLGMNYLLIFMRSETWSKEWINEKGPYDENQFKVILECVKVITSDIEKIYFLQVISSELAKQGKFKDAENCLQEAIEFAQIKYDDGWLEYQKGMALIVISSELIKQGKLEKASFIINMAFDIALNFKISGEDLLEDISFEFIKLNKFDEAFQCVSSITDKFKMYNALENISVELFKLNKFEVVFEFAKAITDDIEKIHIFQIISSELARQGKFDEALECAKAITSDIEKKYFLQVISSELAKKGRFDKALECIQDIFYDSDKSLVIKDISAEMFKQGYYQDAENYIKKSLEFTKLISDEFEMNIAYEDISLELAYQGRFQEAIECARLISDEFIMHNTFNNISVELAKLSKFKEAIECSRLISDEFKINIALINISSEMEKQELVEQATIILKMAVKSVHKFKDENCLYNFSIELIKQGRFNEGIECADAINDELLKIDILIKISNIMAQFGEIQKSATAIKKVLERAKGISNNIDKKVLLKSISVELDKQGKNEKALKIIKNFVLETENNNELETNFSISRMTSEILAEMESHDNIDEFAYDFWKSVSKRYISIELVKQGNWSLAEKTALEITQISQKQILWKEIATMLNKEKGWKKGISIVYRKKLQTQQANCFYLKGWVESIEINKVNDECILYSLKLLTEDPESFDILLQKHALNQLFFEELSEDKIQRFNRTFNLQWAIDLKNELDQLPN